jgi:hypothetical protein
MSVQAGNRVVKDLEELAHLVSTTGDVYLRYSEGYEADADSRSTDTESGLQLPGLSVNPLRPEAWWTRPLKDWLARQICQYKHLGEREERHAWLLRGTCVGRGPDCEPLLADIQPLGRLDSALLDEAEQVYKERFDALQGH